MTVGGGVGGSVSGGFDSTNTGGSTVTGCSTFQSTLKKEGVKERRTGIKESFNTLLGAPTSRLVEDREKGRHPGLVC